MPDTTATAVRGDDFDVLHYVRIEGIGTPNAGGTSDRLYVFTRLPDWTAPAGQRYIGGLRVEGSFTQSVPVYGGVANTTGISIEVQDFTDETVTPTIRFWSALMATERWQNDPATFPHTFLRQAVDRDDLVVRVNSIAGFAAGGGVIWIGNECIHYTSTADGGDPRFIIGATGRGQHPVAGSQFAHTHRIRANEDGEELGDPAMVTTRPMTMLGREVAIYALHRHSTGAWEVEGSALRRFTGIIRKIDWVPERHSYRFMCEPITAQLEREVFSLAPYRSQVVGLNLGALAEWREVRVRITLSDGTVATASVTLSQYTDNTETLLEAIRSGIASDFSAGGWSVAFLPLIDWAPRGGGDHNWRMPLGDEITVPEGHVLIAIAYGDVGAGTFVVNGQFTFSESVARAMGWPSATTMEFSVDRQVTDETFYRISPDAAPSVLLSEGWLYDHATTVPRIRVQSIDGIVTNQGDHADGIAYVLIGDRLLFRVSATVAGAPSRLEGDTLLDGTLVAYAGGGFATLIGSDESPIPVRQVYVPDPEDHIVNQLRRATVSTGTAGYNGAQDVLRTGYGCGIREAHIEQNSWTLLEWHTAEAGYSRGRVIDGPMKLSEWMQEEAQVVGFSVVMLSGQIALRRMPLVALAADAVLTITQSDLRGTKQRISWSKSWESVRNAVLLHWDYRIWNQSFRAPATVYASLESLDGSQHLRKHEVKHRGLRGTEGDLASVIGQLAGRFSMFKRPVAVLRLELKRRMWGRIVPGDTVLLTNPALPDPFTGTAGVTSRLCLVTSVTEHFHGGVDAEVVMLNHIRQAPLAPSALLDYNRGDGGWDAATLRLYCLSGEFQRSGAGVDVSFFSATDRIMLAEDTPTNEASRLVWNDLTVDTVNTGANYIQLTGALPAPAFDAARRYFVTFGHHDVATTDQRTRGTFIGDDATRRIDPSNEWYIYTE